MHSLSLFATSPFLTSRYALRRRHLRLQTAPTSAVTRSSSLIARAGEHDLTVVGAGVLGRRIAQQWHELHTDAVIHAETLSTAAHAGLKAAHPFLRVRTADTADVPRTPQVVFCAPPSGTADYIGAVQRAVERVWSGDAGTLVFTSSVGVYAEPSADEDASPLTEQSPVTADTGRSSNAAKLVACERVVLDAGGTVVRLAGLYTLERGPHHVWLTRGRATGDPNGLISLISYDDAARAIVAALERQLRRETLLVVDGRPMTRRAICASARQSRRYQMHAMPQFVSAAGEAFPERPPHGRRYDNAYTRRLLGDFQPADASFAAFMDQVAAAEAAAPSTA